MQPNSRLAQRKGKESRYLEVHIKENGEIFFSNISDRELKLLKNISGQEYQPGDFYCG
jgi:hypothetical protein